MNTPTPCTGRTRTGRPCRAWAMRGSHPPRCRAHRNDADNPDSGTEQVTDTTAVVLTRPGFPSVAALQDEIQLVRIILARLLEELQAAPGPEQLLTFAPLIFAGTRTVSHLLRDQQALSGNLAEELVGLLSQALDEMDRDWVVAL